MGWLMQQGKGIGLYRGAWVRFGDTVCSFNLLPKSLRWKSHFCWAHNCEKVRARAGKHQAQLIRQVFWKSPNFTQSRVCTFWCRTWCCLPALGLQREAGAAPLLGSGGAFAIWSAGFTDKSRRRLFSLFKCSAVTWKVLLFTALLTQESGRNMAALAAFLLKLFVSNLLMLTKQ